MAESKEYLEKLAAFVQGKPHPIPAWLEDLLVAGPRLEEWPPVKYTPNRVIITEFLARWLKFAGLSEEECLQWLDPYCCNVLKRYSKSGMSAVRHGTKANTRWVYKSDFKFDFEAMAQEPPEPGFENSPAYFSMFVKWDTRQVGEKDRARKAYVPPVFVTVLPVKQRFREQFEKAVELGRQKRSEGLGLAEIVRLLNDQGFRTRTGRMFTEGTLFQSLRRTYSPPKIQTEPSSAPADPGAGSEPNAT